MSKYFLYFPIITHDICWKIIQGVQEKKVKESLCV